MTEAEKLLPEFDAEFALTRKFLALVPDDQLTFKPHEKSMELARLAWHLATFPDWCFETFDKDTFVITSESSQANMNEWKGKKQADMLAKFDADLPRARAALAGSPDAAFENHWKLEWSGKVVIDEPRYGIFRRMVMNHQVHHRAQLGVYFRLLGIALPGSYGASADDKPAQSAA